ncbi:MAG: DHH family phosphoesterase [Nanoarchaeota archaeon]|nr:DHH family phosphoesterase [Nanoarchaeota archaeon]
MQSLEVKIKYFVKEFLEQIKDKELEIISHFDTDGITSASIMTQTLSRIDKKFSIKIVKSLNEKIINSVNKNKILLLLDLGSGNLKHIKNSGIKKVFIIDHHQIDQEIPLNLEIINPELHEKQKISSSGLVYLFAKEIDKKNQDMAKLAILGMIGDQLEKDIDQLNHKILEDSQIQKRKGLLIYPSTRPLNKVLEYSSNPFIPGVSGNPEGVIELLRESGINPENKKYKSILELTKQEMENLVTSIILRNPEKKQKEFLGNLYLIKMFGKLEDAREISAKINACSKNGNSGIAMGYCMENSAAKKKADSIHVKYRQQLLTGIKEVENIKKIENKKFVIINAQNKIKDTMIGTIISILSNSPKYPKKTILIGMSHDLENKKIKISARISGGKGRNLKEILSNVMKKFKGDVGGHSAAAGCSIEFDKEQEFINSLQEELEKDILKIK